MDAFLTWDVLITFSGLVGAVYMITEFTKDLKLINKIPTKYWSFLISFFLLVVTNLVIGKFEPKELVLCAINAIVVSLSANGLSNFNDVKPSSKK